MASEIGVDDGKLLAISKGLHLYEYSWELARITAGME
jgi:thymidylate synthase